MLDYLMLFAQTAEATDPTGKLKYLALMAALGLIAVILSYVVILFAFYEAGEMDEALVRSGAGGPKVAIQGGLWKFPKIHKFQRVTLRSLKLDVRSGRQATTGDQSLDGEGNLVEHEGSSSGDGREGIARGMGVIRDSDHLPIIINAEFYVHVPAKEDYVINAARTLGEKADPKQGEGRGKHWEKKSGKASEDVAILAIREFAQEKLWGALRGVAGTMTLQEMHQNRLAFTDNVANALEHDLKENGLELESVAIESLDQEPLRAVEKRAGEGSVFDEGALTTLITKVEAAKTARNDARKREEAKREDADTQYREASVKFEERRILATAEQEERVKNKTRDLVKSIETFEAAAHLEQTKVVEDCGFEANAKIEQVAIDFEKLQSDLEKSKRTLIAQNEREFGLAELSRDQDLETEEEKVKEAIELRAIGRVATVGNQANECKQQVGVAKENALAEIGVAGETKLLRISERQKEVADANTYTNTAKAEAERAEQSISTARIEEELRGNTVAPVAAEATAEVERKKKVVLSAEASRDKDVLNAQGTVALAHGSRDSDLAKGASASAILSRGQAEAESRRLDGEAEKVYAQAEVIQAEKQLLNKDAIGKYLYAKNAPLLAAHLKDAVAAAFKPMEGMIDGFKILQVNTDGGSENGGPFGDIMRTITRNAPAGALLNEMLSMSGSDLKVQDLLEKLFGTITTTLAGKSSPADPAETS